MHMKKAVYFRNYGTMVVKIVCWLGLLLLTSLHCYAQDHTSQTVTGAITDGQQRPIAGASVQVKGRPGKGAVSTDNGHYLIQADSGATLIFSAVGYTSQALKSGLTGILNVELADSINHLNEIVVIGYGTVKKKDLTGAVTSIKGTDMKTEGVSSLTKALQGKMPGVTVESAGGNPGAGTRILIRGVGTFGSATPLYIVDGVQVTNINNLSSTDIESIDVLKDASAAAIYGSRAANGVVLVTTRLGLAGPPVVHFNANLGLQTIENKMDVLNAEQWAMVSNAAHEAAGHPVLDIAKNPETLGAGTDWQDAIYRKAPTQNYELMIGGGSKDSRYSISGSYLDQDGIVQVTGYKRYNLRVKSETTKGRFKFGQTALLSREKWVTMAGGWGGQGGNPVGSAAKMIPVFDVFDTAATGGYSGAYGPVMNVANPVAQLHLEDIDRELTSILVNGYVQVSIVKGLDYKLNLGYTNAFGTSRDYFKRNQVGTLFSHPTNDISLSKDQNVQVLLENTLNYHKEIGKHHIQALVGYTYQKNKYTYTSAARTDLPDGIRNIDAGAGVSTAGGNSNENSLLSMLGRFIYSYDNRYLLTASIRRDGSSRFGNGYRYGNFPSIALGWNIANESFFEGWAEKVSTLKLRASYGELGNQQIGDYLYAAAIVSNINYVIGADQHKWFGAIQTAFASPDIKWENTQTSNIGLDLGLYNNRLNLTFDYFVKKTTDVLLNVPIPGSAGSVSNPVVNAGTIQNNGVELGINYGDKIGALEFNVFGTFSKVNNKVLALGTGTQQLFGGQPTHHGASTTVTEAGGPISAFYLIKAIGIFNSEAEVKAYTNADGHLIQPNASAGDIKFLDNNNDGQISDLDKVYMGSPFPDFEYGFGFNARFQGFDLNLFFQGTSGNKIYNGLRQDLESMSLEFNYSTATLNAWTPERHTNFPRAVIDDPNFNDRTSSRFLESGSYLRMKTIQLGYTFSGDWLEKLKLTSFRIYASGDNLFTATQYSGYNPDIGRSGSILDRGVDFGHVAYPLAKVYSVGVQLAF